MSTRGRMVWVSLHAHHSSPTVIPDDAIFLHDCQSAVLETDASRVDVIIAFQFLELKTRVRRIALEQTIGAFGVPLHFEGQIRE